VQSKEHGQIKTYKPKRIDRDIKISGGDGPIRKELESFRVDTPIFDYFCYKNNKKKYLLINKMTKIFLKDRPSVINSSKKNSVIAYKVNSLKLSLA
jgi:hypothetical protein